jgi:hypothetical protein
MDPELVISLIRWASVGLFSVLVPIGIYVGRANIRVSRREIVRDLERLFQFAKAKADGRPVILPSFELVKYKYDPDSNPDRPGDELDANSFRFYAFPVGMYVILTLLCFNFAFRDVDVVHPSASHFSNPEGTVGGIITYAFLSSYIWSIQYLIRRIANFDLSPISFFQALFISCWPCSFPPQCGTAAFSRMSEARRWWASPSSSGFSLICSSAP